MLRGKRQAAVGYHRTIEAWPSLPEPIQRATAAIIHRRLAAAAGFVEGGQLAIVDAARQQYCSGQPHDRCLVAPTPSAIILGMNYDESRMQKMIVAMLDAFSQTCPDQESLAEVRNLAADFKLWPRAHDLFSKVRGRNNAAGRNGDRLRAGQYSFEEHCLKALYNASGYPAPFDSDSPFWIFPAAIGLAKLLGVPTEKIVEVCLG